jgi:tetratricopeptide (TPR) repeat protein
LAVLGFVAYGLLAIRLLLKRGVWGVLGFALLFPWLLFFTEFSVVRIQESFVLYRSYFWMPGLFIALPLLIRKLEGKFIAIVLFLISMIFASLALGRLVTFEHRYLLWDDAARLVENKQGIVGLDRIYANRGVIYSDMLRFPEAIEDLKRAISLRPQFGYYHHSLAVIYFQSGANQQALSEFEMAVKLAPENSRGYYGIGLAYMQLNQPDLAKKNLEISCQKGLKPGCDKVAILNSRK